MPTRSLDDLDWYRLREADRLEHSADAAFCLSCRLAMVCGVLTKLQNGRPIGCMGILVSYLVTVSLFAWWPPLGVIGGLALMLCIAYTVVGFLIPLAMRLLVRMQDTLQAEVERKLQQATLLRQEHLPNARSSGVSERSAQHTDAAAIRLHQPETAALDQPAARPSHPPQ